MRARLTFSSILALALAAPAAASAADYYVAKSGSGSVCSAAAPCVTIAAAVTKAADDDTVHVGAGTFTEAIDTTKRLAFVGVGAGTAAGYDAATTTYVVPPASPDGQSALTLRGGGSARAMRLKGDDFPFSQPAGGDGLRIQPAAGLAPVTYDVADVVAIGGVNIVVGAGIRVTSADAPTRPVAVTVSDSTLLSANESIVSSGTSVQTDVRRSVLSGRAFTDVGATVTYDHSTLQDGGVSAGRGRTTIDHSAVVDDYGAAFAYSASGSARLVVRDSILRVLRTGTGAPSSFATLSAVAGTSSSAETNVDVIGSTIYGAGPLRAAVLASRSSGAAGSVDVNVVNSIARMSGADGTTTADVATNSDNNLPAATVAMRNSSFSSVVRLGTPGVVPDPGTGTNVAGDPLLTAPAAATPELTLAPGSPLVDRGATDVLLGGETDMADTPRNVDGNADCQAAPDIGAFERPATACPPATTGGGVAPAGGGGATPGGATRRPRDTRAPVLTKLKISHGRVSLRVDEAAKLTVRIQRRKGKAYRTIRTQATKAAKAGPVALRLSRVPRGRYRVQVVATDAAGNTSKPISASYRRA